MQLEIVRSTPAAGGRNVTDALAEGVRAAGDDARMVTGFRRVTDPVACWGWRKGLRLRAAKRDVLVIERGYVGDRLHMWTSLGWNGLNGHAVFPKQADNGERFERHFGALMKPWKRREKYALILAQVPGDMSCYGVNMEAWYVEAAAAMEARGYIVGLREHPAAVARGLHVRALPDRRVGGTLEDALSVAAVAVTWNSNSGVDAVLAGVPVIACDPGAMCWEVAAHGLDAPIRRPDREAWAARLAWTQWTIDEIASGEAWEHVRAVYPGERVAEMESA